MMFRMVLMMKTWSSVVWICSWPVVKPHQRPCSGASSTSSKTQTSKVCRRSETSKSPQLKCFTKPPHIDRARAEINHVIGEDRRPTMADKPSLPYTDAVIHEIQRIGNIVPLNGLRMAVKDTTLGGYFIPKVSDNNSKLTGNLSMNK